MAEGKRIALLIGVGSYTATDNSPGLKRLHSPPNNIAALQPVLENPKIGHFASVTRLTDPDLATMRSAIELLFANRRKADLVLLYFSGHGVKDQANNLYLTTPTTRLFASGELMRSTAIEASFVRDVMASSLAQQQVVILDCCFSGAFPDGVLAMDDGSVDVQQQLAGEGRAILTAATSTQYALEQAEENLSVYTRYLVEGLATGAAAPEGEETVLVSHLHDYVRSKVRSAAPAMKPELYAAKEGSKILLARVAVGDPELKFRKEVERRVYEGIISGTGQRLLQRRSTQLNLSATRAAEIIEEVLRPYKEKQASLEHYCQALQEEVEQHGQPLPEYILRDLKDFQQELKLRDEDVQPIAAEILGTIPPNPPSKVGRDELQPVENALEAFTVDLGNGVQLEMLAIPGGTFWMGAAEGEAEASQDEYPRHQVTIAPFYMGKFPVTQAQYQAVMGTNPAFFQGNQIEGNQRPVEQVSWWEAIEFCQKLSSQTGRAFRLPSEAEWEYACRAGTETPFFFGETISTEQANYDGNYVYGSGKKGTHRKQTTDAGSFPPNAFGLYDMHGNVWEWCADHWHDSYQGAPIDGSAWLTDSEQARRLLRGGSWSHDPDDCRSANRIRRSPELRHYNFGFRVVCS